MSDLISGLATERVQTVRRNPYRELLATLLEDALLSLLIDEDTVPKQSLSMRRHFRHMAGCWFEGRIRNARITLLELCNRLGWDYRTVREHGLSVKRRSELARARARRVGTPEAAKQLQEWLCRERSKIITADGALRRRNRADREPEPEAEPE